MLEANVVLLWLGKSMESVSSYRPTCLVSALGKLYKRIIKERVEIELEKSGGLSSRQFGFVKGRLTTHAIKAVVDRVRGSKEKLAAAVALDIKNAE